MLWIKSKYRHFYHLLSGWSLIFFSIIFGTISVILLKQIGFTFEKTILISFCITALMILVSSIGKFTFAVLSILTFPIGAVISTSLLAVIYFLIFMPIGWLRGKSFESGWQNSVQIINKSKLYE